MFLLRYLWLVQYYNLYLSDVFKASNKNVQSNTIVNTFNLKKNVSKFCLNRFLCDNSVKKRLRLKRFPRICEILN